MAKEKGIHNYLSNYFGGVYGKKKAMENSNKIFLKELNKQPLICLP